MGPPRTAGAAKALRAAGVPLDGAIFSTQRAAPRRLHSRRSGHVPASGPGTMTRSESSRDSHRRDALGAQVGTPRPPGLDAFVLSMPRAFS